MIAQAFARKRVRMLAVLIVCSCSLSPHAWWRDGNVLCGSGGLFTIVAAMFGALRTVCDRLDHPEQIPGGCMGLTISTAVCATVGVGQLAGGWYLSRRGGNISCAGACDCCWRRRHPDFEVIS